MTKAREGQGTSCDPRTATPPTRTTQASVRKHYRQPATHIESDITSVSVSL